MHAIATFGVSTFGKSLFWAMVEVYGLFSLTNLFGLSPGLAGGLFLALLCWGALADIVAGRIADHLPPGLADGLMRVCAPLAALTFVWSLFPLPGPPLLGQAIIGGVLFRPLYSAMDVPHNALLYDLGREWPGGPVQVAAVRMFAASAAAFVISLAAMATLGSAGPADFNQRFAWLAIAVGVCGALLFLTAPRLAHRRPTAGGPRGRLAAIVREPRVALLFAAVLISVVGFSLFNKALPYVAVGQFADPSWTGRALFALSLGRLAAIWVWPASVRRLGGRAANMIAYAVCGGAAAAFAVLSREAMDLCLFVLGVGVGGTSLLSWTLTADIVRDLQGDGRNFVQATMFGLLTSLSKAALGVGGAALGLLLSITGGPSNPQVGYGLSAWTAGLALALFCLAALACLRAMPDGAPHSGEKKARKKHTEAAPTTPA